MITVAEAPVLLAQLVREHRLVILGEEHHQSEHRAFGARVLPLLRRAGITHLALETSDQALLDQAIQTRLVTPATDGWFTAGPRWPSLPARPSLSPMKYSAWQELLSPKERRCTALKPIPL